MSNTRILPLVTTLAASSLSADVIPLQTVKDDVFGPSITVVEEVNDPIDGQQFRLVFEGFPGLDYNLNSGLDLENWFPRGSVVTTEGIGVFVEPFPQDERRFYQVSYLGSGDASPPVWPVSAALSALEVHDTLVDLIWPAATDDAGVVAYAIYGNGVHLLTVGSNVTGVVIDGLEPDTQYEFEVIACDEGANCTQLPEGLTLRTRSQQEPPLNATRAGSVFVPSGEFSLSRTDLFIRSRELGLVVTRTYRSGLQRDSPFGYGWSSNVFERLWERSNGDLVWQQGNGRSDTFSKQAGGDYLAPPGIFMTLTLEPGGFRLIAPNGTTRRFDSDGKIQSITTRNANIRRYTYTGQLLTSITDEMGRSATLDYNPDGRVERITDFTGREFHYEYDVVGNLISVRSPLVTGTPNGNDFPEGKTERYAYDSGRTDPCLAHNLIQVIAPKEVADGSMTPCQVLSYGDTGQDYDRVIAHTIGGMNASNVPAGGTMSFTYWKNPASNSGGSGLDSRTDVTDARGNRTQYEFDPNGLLTTRTDVLADRADPVTTHSYDVEGRLLTVTHPEGNVTSYAYDFSHPSRRSQGNLLRVRKTPGPRGATQPELIQSFTYEPVFNQVRSATDPRGFTSTNTFDFEEECDFAAIGATIGLTTGEVEELLVAAGLCTGDPPGDLNADGDLSQESGNVIRRSYPTVALAPDSNQAVLEGDLSQEVVEFFQYNSFGQLSAHRDPEANQHSWSYFPESDPDGNGTQNNPAGDATTGGYLKMTVVDAAAGTLRNSETNPPIAAITTTFVYNERGRTIARFDPRGIRTSIIVNELDQPVQVRQADLVNPGHPNLDTEPVPPSPFDYLTEYFYDANNNLVQKDVEDREDSSNTGGTITTTLDYDIFNQLLRLTEEIDVDTTRTTKFRYDANGNRVLVVQPEGNAVAFRYEERNLVTSVTKGAMAAPSEALVSETQVYDPRGGTPSTVTYAWDGNGNLVATTDAADTDGSGDNNGPVGGDLTTYTYDGYDRMNLRTDSIGNQITRGYDANGNVVDIQQFGPDGGPSPVTNTPSTNLLARTLFHFDEQNRLVQRDRLLFANTIAADLGDGAVDLGKGDLVPGDNAVNQRFEYDRNGRRTFEVDDDGDTTSMRYDGAGRCLLITDAAGNIIERAYCDLGNVIEIRETDRSTLGTVPDEVVLTTFLYDASNRRTTMVDNLGNTTRYVYDSRHNLVTVSDPNGPSTGTTFERRAFPNASTTVNVINSHGNVVNFYYDGLNRSTRTERILTSSGLGDGTLTPLPDPLQGGGDGLITTRTFYDKNDLPIIRSDDNQFRTIQSYDNLDRTIAQSHGSCGLPALAGYNCDPATTEFFSYDADHNLVQRTDEAGNVFDNTFDAENRLIRTGITRASGVSGVTQQEFEYDGLGRLWGGFDNHLNIVFRRHFDSLSRVVRETTEVPGIGTFHTDSAWRAANLRSGVTYPTGTSLEFRFDTLDRITQIGDASGQVANYEYIGRRLLEENFPNGMSNIHRFDGLRRTSQVGAVDAEGTPLVRHAYAWDRTRNRLSESKTQDPANDEAYSYDSAYRLLEFMRPNLGAAAPLQSSWTLDGNGNWKEVDGAIRHTSSFNEVAGITPLVGGTVAFTSDDNGNLTGDPTAAGGAISYEFDANNRLISATKSGGPTISYFYDPLGRRIVERDGNTHEVVFLHDGSNVIADWDAQGHEVGTPGTPGVLREFVLSAKAVNSNAICNDGTPAVYYARRPARCKDADGNQFFYHYNSIDSVIALTPAAGSGAELVRYDAYGAPSVSQVGGLAPTGNPYLHASRRQCYETGLYYNRARYYDVQLGRFLSRDPLGFWGDESNHGNPYTYCNNNPVNGVDPTGRFNTLSFDGRNTIRWHSTSIPIEYEINPVETSTSQRHWGNDFQIGVITTEADETFNGYNPGELVGAPRPLPSSGGDTTIPAAVHNTSSHWDDTDMVHFHNPIESNTNPDKTKRNPYFVTPPPPTTIVPAPYPNIAHSSDTISKGIIFFNGHSAYNYARSAAVSHGELNLEDYLIELEAVQQFHQAATDTYVSMIWDTGDQAWDSTAVMVQDRDGVDIDLHVLGGYDQSTPPIMAPAFLQDVHASGHMAPRGFFGSMTEGAIWGAGLGY